jgi:hypothetical protein
MSLSFFEKLSVPTPMTNQHYLERIDLFRRLIEVLESMRHVNDTSSIIDVFNHAILDLEERMDSHSHSQRGFRG